MPRKPLEGIEEHFSKVTDPRRDRTKEHKLIDIITIAICAVICGAEGRVDVALFGKSELPRLKTFLGLPNGIKRQSARDTVESRRVNVGALPILNT